MQTAPHAVPVQAGGMQAAPHAVPIRTTTHAPVAAAPTPTTAPVSAPASHAPAAPLAPASAAAKVKTPTRHPPLPSDQHARPPQALVAKLQLPAVSRCDRTLFVAFPPNRRRTVAAKLPRHSNGDSKLAIAVGELLTKSLGIPAPRLLKALSQHDSVVDLHHALEQHPTFSSAVNRPHQLATFMSQLSTAASTDSGDTATATALLATPLGPHLPDSHCHSSWFDYLNPSTDVLKSSSPKEAGVRHVIRLAFNSELVATAVQAHIQRYTSLLRPKGQPAYTPAELDVLEPWQRSWVRAASRDGVLHMDTDVTEYAIRYETTLVCGFSPDTDHTLLPSEDGVYGEMYGSYTRFCAFLATHAPHCAPCPLEGRRGSSRIQFVHEAKYRYELYRLAGRVSPQHGITRPLRLTYMQLRRAQVQCCSACGAPGHMGRVCHLRQPRPAPPAADDGKMEVDEARPSGTPLAPLLSEKQSVCHECYSHAHPHPLACPAPPADVKCKVCDEVGHSSFRCRQYRTSWAPLTAPVSSHAPNPRPLALIAQQCGRPRPTWSDVASPARVDYDTTSTPHPPAPALADPHAFPALPGSRTPAAPASVTDSAPSSPMSSSASSPASPTPVSAELAELKAIVAQQARSLQSLQERGVVPCRPVQAALPL